jgi:diguanylate cyclase (GGDEF)-like protein
MTLALEAAHERARSSTAAHRLARRLAHAHTARAVWDIVVRGMATAVNARLGALALPESADQRLEIVRTYGYPIELVEHLRIEPGTGVLGSVFESGRLLHVSRAADVPERPVRPRYRTPSFVAVPIGFRTAPLGVVCVADRRDNQAFTRADVSTLRALAAPAALALDRERAAARADRYARAATVDPLSGAFNRRYFDARLEEELQRSRRHPNAHAVALLMLDLDDFKLINDSYGHPAGDTVICDIAEILRRSVRVFDVCARFGGEEFAILMPNSSLESAVKVAARIREQIESYHPIEPGLGELRTTASIGLAMSAPPLTGRELVARADEALYEAKRQGKNRVRIADSMATETIIEGPTPDD